jgi:hypothetical protein
MNIRSPSSTRMNFCQVHYKRVKTVARKGCERSVNQQLSNKEGRSGAMQASLSVSVTILFKIVWPDFIQVGYKILNLNLTIKPIYTLACRSSHQSGRGRIQT